MKLHCRLLRCCWLQWRAVGATWGLGHELEGEGMVESLVGVEVEVDVCEGAEFLWIHT